MTTNGGKGYQPGPWEVCGLFADFPGIEGTKTSIIIFGYSEEGDTGVKGETKEQAIANARLIASAPDLLEALVAFVKWVEDEASAASYDAGMGVSEWKSFIPTYLSERFNKARAAIARAEGEG